MDRRTAIFTDRHGDKTRVEMPAADSLLLKYFNAQPKML